MGDSSRIDHLYKTKSLPSCLQVPFDQDNQDVTALVIHMELFRLTQMPFGLSSAPSWFKKNMVTIFAGIPGVTVHLDDIVVHVETPALDNDHLSRVLEVVGVHQNHPCSTFHSNVDTVLCMPELSLPLSPTFVTCDVSNTAAGADLSQLHQGQNAWWLLPKNKQANKTKYISQYKSGPTTGA